ncbi:MAG TPA: hypothetical protein VIM53_03205 [Candidatus Saccharimonadales bacterium]
MSYEYALSAEAAQERAMHVERLATVEQAAQNGEFGERTYSLAAAEIEFQIFEGREDQLPYFIDGDLPPEHQALLAKIGAVLPPRGSSVAIANKAQREVDAADLKAEAYGIISNLTPQSFEEAEMQRRWLEQVPFWSTSECINFALYKEFSRPTLQSTTPPKGVSYNRMLEHSEQSGWLEWRCGTDEHQVGWYDNPGVFEMRFSPCPPSEMVERERAVMQRLLELSTQYGVMLCNTSLHANLSVYQARPRWANILMPVIGTNAMRQPATLDAISGLSAAVEDGVWMSEEYAKDNLLFGAGLGSTRSIVEVSQNRTSIRLLDDYVELRGKQLKTSLPQGLLWMLSGMTYGLQHGARQLAENGHATAEIEQAFAAVRTEQFDKNKHLQFQRAFENSTWTPEDGFKIDVSHSLNRSKRIAESILEVPMDSAASSAFNGAFMKTLKFDDEGKVLLDKHEFYMTLLQLHPDLTDALLKNASGMTLLEMATRATGFIAHDAVRLRKVDRIVAHPQYPGLSPDEWERRWQESPIMRRAYGEQVGVYARSLGKVAAAHFVEYDFNDSETILRLFEEVLSRHRQA